MVMLRRILIAAAILAGYWLVWMVLVEPQLRVEHRDLGRHHGADLITEAWDGTVTAYFWQNGKYNQMWVRKATWHGPDR